MSVKEGFVEMEGVVKEALRGAMFRVGFENGHEIIARISGKIQKHFIKILPGDKVRCEISTYDYSKGRIKYRVK